MAAAANDSSLPNARLGPGAATQLYAVGPQDSYIRGGIEASFFRPSHVQHSHYTSEVVELRFSGLGFKFGETCSAPISLDAGDLLGDISLEIRLPAVPGAGLLDVWAPKIGYVLLRKVKLIIDGAVIGENERLFLDLHDTLFCPCNKRWGLDRLIGDVVPGSGGGGGLSMREAHVLHVPLRLPTSRTHRPTSDPGAYVPLLQVRPGTSMVLQVEAETFLNSCVLDREGWDAGPRLVPTVTSPDRAAAVVPAQPGQTVALLASDGTTVLATQVVPGGGRDMVVFEDLADDVDYYAAIDGSTPPTLVVAHPDILARRVTSADVRVLGTYVFVTQVEKAGMMRAGTMRAETETSLLFDSAQDVEARTQALKVVRADVAEVSMAARYLAFAVYKRSSILEKRYFQYEVLDAAFSRGFLRLNGEQLFEAQSMGWFALVQPYLHFPTASMPPPATSGRVGALSFALDPSSRSPSGILNLAKFTRPTLELETRATYVDEDSVLKVFVVSHNFLVNTRGQLQTLYS